MITHVALLRGINVGGRNQVGMSDLRELLTELGFAGARSLLQSGNLVFASDDKSDADLEALLETAVERRFNLRTDILVRTASQWRAVVKNNHFPDEAEHDPSHLLVMFLKRKPSSESVAALRAAIAGREVVHADGKQLYVTYPDGIGRSRLTNSLIDSKLGVRGTGRNWNTVLKLNAMANG